MRWRNSVSKICVLAARDAWAHTLLMTKQSERAVYPGIFSVENEVRIWWGRRHGEHRAYVRSVLRHEIRRLRYLRGAR